MMKRMLHSFDDFISIINYHRDMCDDIDHDDDEEDQGDGSVGVDGEKNRCRRIFFLLSPHSLLYMHPNQTN